MLSKRKESSRSRFYRLSAWLHLWLGLITGTVVIVVCLTGCIWVFQEEITSVLLEPESNVPYQKKPVVLPSRLMRLVANEFPGKRIGSAEYRQGRAISISLAGQRGEGAALTINPYSGQIIHKTSTEAKDTNFFDWILEGHRFLWLPHKLGRPIVNYSTLLFVFTLITGLVLWWPHKWTKSTRQRSFKVKWQSSAKRVNYDLHNVVGFYSLLVVAAIAMTGMVYGLDWFGKGVYWTTTGGTPFPGFGTFNSDTLQTKRPYSSAEAMDLAWQRVADQHPNSNGFRLAFPDSVKRKAVIIVTVYPSAGVIYDNQGYIYDQFTLKELPKDKIYGQLFAADSFGNQVRRLNYDIHIGAVLGLPGKVLAFLASLIGASLPVTGFIIWWGKGKPKQGKRKKINVGHRQPLAPDSLTNLPPAIQ